MWTFVWAIARVAGKMGNAFERAMDSRLPKIPSPERERREALFRGHTLFHFQLSPYSRRVRRVIAELGLGIPLKDTLDDSAAWNELMEHGKRDMVPCLKIETPGESTRWMYESTDIVAYLKQRMSAK